MKKFLFLLIPCFLLANDINSQKSIDSILLSLNNNDLYISPIIRGVSVTGPAKVDNTDSLKKVPFFRVSSLKEDVQTLADRFSKQILVEKLCALLKDPSRDLYANALLYDLLDNNMLGKLLFMKRARWVSEGRKEIDTHHWEAFVQKGMHKQ